jgi:hypothetical protein
MTARCIAASNGKSQTRPEGAAHQAAPFARQTVCSADGGSAFGPREQIVAVRSESSRDLSHINIFLPDIFSPPTSRGDFNMRKFILIAGFVLASAAAQAGDRSLSLGGDETSTATAPARAPEGSRIVEAPPAAEAPKYIERPAVVEPSAEAPKAEAPKTVMPKTVAPRAAATRTQATKFQQSAAGPARPAARRSASMARMSKPRLTRHWVEARIVRELYRYGIYW